jgi:hypothetical protein
MDAIPMATRTMAGRCFFMPTRIHDDAPTSDRNLRRGLLLGMGLRLPGQTEQAGDHAEDSGAMKWAERILFFVGGAAAMLLAVILALSS